MNKIQLTVKEINLSIKEICAKNGVDFESFKISEDKESTRIKLEISEIHGGLTRFQRLYLDNLHAHDLEPEWLTNQVIYKLERYQILGYYPKKYKKPVRVFNHTKQKDEFLHPDKVRAMWSCQKFYKGRN